MGELLLVAALTFTVAHMATDIYLAVRHMAHPKDMALTTVSIIALTGHVILTGELTSWVGRLTWLT